MLYFLNISKIKFNNLKIFTRYFLVGFLSIASVECPSTVVGAGVVGPRRNFVHKVHPKIMRQKGDVNGGGYRYRGTQNRAVAKKGNSKLKKAILPVLGALVVSVCIKNYHASLSPADDDTDSDTDFSSDSDSDSDSDVGQVLVGGQLIPVLPKLDEGDAVFALKLTIEDKIIALSDADYHALFKNYATGKTTYRRIKNRIMINHEQEFATFQKVLSLHQDIEKYFNSDHGAYGNPDGKDKKQLFTILAKHHIGVIDFLDKGSRMYKNTENLYAAYGVDVDKIKRDRLKPYDATLPYHFAYDIDSQMKNIIDNSGDNQLKELYNKKYTSKADLQLADKVNLVDLVFVNKMFDENIDGSQKIALYRGKRDEYDWRADDILQGKDYNGVDMLPFVGSADKREQEKARTSQAIKKAYDQGYLSKAHILAWLIYTEGMRVRPYVKAQTYGHKMGYDKELDDTKYFHAVYRDSLKRIEYMDSQADLQQYSPNLFTIKKLASGGGKIDPLYLHRGLSETKRLQFKACKGRAPYALSTTYRDDTADLFKTTTGRYILGFEVDPSKSIALDARGFSSCQGQGEIILSDEVSYKVTEISLFT